MEMKIKRYSPQGECMYLLIINEWNLSLKI